MANKFMRLNPSSPAENTSQSFANQVLSNLRQELRSTLAHLQQLEIAIEQATGQMNTASGKSQAFEDISIQAKNEDIAIQPKSKEQQAKPAAPEDYYDIDINLKR